MFSNKKQERRQAVGSFIKNVASATIGCMVAFFALIYITDAWIGEDQMRCEATMESVGKDPKLCK